MIGRPRSYQVGPFTVRRDATRCTWRVFDEHSKEVMASPTQQQAMAWAEQHMPHPADCQHPDCRVTF
jgi:hypothetical protein